ncbi:enoyl-CoA hydratase-related protein [Pseudomonadota bacterium]
MELEFVMSMHISEYQTLQVDFKNRYTTVTINRPANNNTINSQLLEELNSVIDISENDTSIVALVLQGGEEIFCAGMDFEESISLPDDQIDKLSSLYMSTLKRFSLSPLIVISNLNGQVLAGGVGIVAASDLVIATPRSYFSLSEILWGLLPACVLPYLIRRVSFQAAYAMTLTSKTVHADEANQINLIDILTGNPQDEVRKLMIKLRRLDRRSILDAKLYFRKIWMLDESMELSAIKESSRLAVEPRVRRNIHNYVNKRVYPWDTQSEV